ncbi:MAG: metal-dependent hydrolase [Candidatus Hodarchaeales archaeon]
MIETIYLLSRLIYAIFPFLDPIALFIGSIAPDIEGVSAIFIFRDPNLPLHGSFHSFLGAITLGLLLTPISYIINSFITTRLFRIEKKTISKKYSLVASMVGTFSHIMLDAPLYPEMNPFYPLKGNVFFQIVPYYLPYLICTMGMVIGLVVIINRHYRKRNKD